MTSDSAERLEISATPAPLPMMKDGKVISRRWRIYTLVLLAMAYGVNMADRGILSIVAPGLKKEFHFHDWQIGVLAGPVFAVVYSVCSLPISSIADRFNRRNLVAATMLLYGGATVACGFAVSYWQLAVGRFLTGSAEAATVPAANSVIADLYPPEKRVAATAVFTSGGSVGAILATVAGGYIAHAYGWREAFMAAGVPGVILALLAGFTAREPRRLISAAQAAQRASVSLLAVAKHLWSQKTFHSLCLAEIFLIFQHQGAGAFNNIFFVQTHGFNVAQLGAFRSGFAVASIAVTLLVGKLIDQQSKRDLRWLMWCSAIVAIGGAPFAFASYVLPDRWAALTVSNLGFLFSVAYVAPMMATCQALAPNIMRARAVAIMFMIANLFGMGLGPPAAGLISDSLVNTFGENEALRWALIIMVIPNFIAGYFYMRGARTLRADHNRAREMDGLSPI